jgi:hypothetical protein
MNRMNVRSEIDQQFDDSRRSPDDSPVQRGTARAIASMHKRGVRSGQGPNAAEIAAFCRDVNGVVTLSGWNPRA